MRSYRINNSLTYSCGDGGGEERQGMGTGYWILNLIFFLIFMFDSKLSALPVCIF